MTHSFRSWALAGLALAACGAAYAQAPAGIETQELRQLDAWSVGALPRDRGGLGADLWSGTDPAVLNALLNRLPASYDSPAMLGLARRVLLSGGDAPQGDAQDAARERFEALGKMGAADELATMAAGSGPGASDPVIAQYAAQAELARGRNNDACARGRAAVSEPPAPFILRLRAFCAAIGGDRAAADLALERIRSGGAEAAWYNAAVSAAAGAPGAHPPAARYDNSLAVQLSLAAHLHPSATPLTGASNLALVALARADATPQPVRAQAAALAFRRGVMSASDVRTVLDATPAEITTGLPAIATARRAVKAAPGSADAAAIIANTLRAAAAPNDFYAAARFFKDDIAALNTAPNSAAAVLYARAALVSGDVALAQRLLQSARAANVPAATLAPLEAAFAVLSTPNGGDASVATRRIAGAGASLAKAAARDVAILDAMGFALDAGAQTFLSANAPAGGAPADATLLGSMNAAAQRHSTGETGIAAVLAAGAGPARLDAASVVAIIRALRAVGLDADARRVAVEALLAGQPAR